MAESQPESSHQSRMALRLSQSLPRQLQKPMDRCWLTFSTQDQQQVLKTKSAIPTLNDSPGFGWKDRATIGATSIDELKACRQRGSSCSRLHNSPITILLRRIIGVDAHIFSR